MHSSNLLKIDDRIQLLIEDCQSIWIEHDFQSRWYRVMGYHELGKRLLAEPKEYGDKFVPLVAESIGKSERTLYRAMEFAKTFPDLDAIPEGKNISWYLVIHKYLPSEAKNETLPGWVHICPNCKYEQEKKAVMFVRKEA